MIKQIDDVASDHWHRTENDPGRPFAFKEADTLLADFFQEVRHVLKERGITETVQDFTTRQRRQQDDPA